MGDNLLIFFLVVILIMIAFQIWWYFKVMCPYAKGEKIYVCDRSDQWVRNEFVERIFVVIHNGVTYCEHSDEMSPGLLQGWEYSKKLKYDNRNPPFSAKVEIDPINTDDLT